MMQSSIRNLKTTSSLGIIAAMLLMPLSHASMAQGPADNPISVPLKISPHKNIVLDARLNDSETLQLMLHTAASDVTLTEQASQKAKSVIYTGSSKVKAWGGQSESRFSEHNFLQMGDFTRRDIVIWEDLHSGHGTDGKFGLELFGKKIVELNLDESLLVIHERLPSRANSFKSIAIDNRDGQLFVHGVCEIDNQRYEHDFLIHSGYSGGLLLDDQFAQSTGIDGKIKVTEESRLKDSFGKEIQIKKGVLPVFALGDVELQKVNVGFFAGTIGSQRLSVAGCEVWTQFNLIFDLEDKKLYLSRRR